MRGDGVVEKMEQGKKEWIPPTEALWLQWRLDFAKHLQGVTLQYQKYNRWSESWDHDHCAACWVEFAEFNGPDIQHEGYATCEDYKHGARYEWVCRECFEDLREFMGWKLTEGSDQLQPEASPRASVWRKGKLPRIECSITFLSATEGGRPSPPQSLSADSYRPHLVIGDPDQRQSVVAHGKRAAEEYIAVAFHEGPAAPHAAKELIVVLTLLHFPNPMYGKLSPGITFTVREGAKIVGFGKIRRWLD
jgi:hypothetical protein